MNLDKEYDCLPKSALYTKIGASRNCEHYKQEARDLNETKIRITREHDMIQQDTESSLNSEDAKSADNRIQWQAVSFWRKSIINDSTQLLTK